MRFQEKIKKKSEQRFGVEKVLEKKEKSKKENLQCILDSNENPSYYHYEKIKLIPRTFKIPVRHFTK